MSSKNYDAQTVYNIHHSVSKHMLLSEWGNTYLQGWVPGERKGGAGINGSARSMVIGVRYWFLAFHDLTFLSQVEAFQDCVMVSLGHRLKLIRQLFGLFGYFPIHTFSFVSITDPLKLNLKPEIC